jgi:D-glycero-D-manno-heptose 1,7-bisphosphate phosphatase
MKQPSVFLDRDGTLIEEVGYLDRLDRLRMFPWSIDAVRLLNRGGFKVVVVSNQAGVARGFFDESFVREVQREVGAQVADAGGRIDAWYYCPHHPDAPLAEYRLQCECRKPRPGMIRQAEEDLDIDTTRSFVVGDRWLDVALAQNVGARGILVRTGYGGSEEHQPHQGTEAAFVADDLMEAVSWILRTTAAAK